MNKQNKLIRQLAGELFDQQNKDPEVSFEANFVERGQDGKSGAGEATRQEYLKRAERKLIERGTIDNA